jgi:hypothetical protein
MDNNYEKMVGKMKLEVVILKKGGVMARVTVDLQKPPILIKGFTVRIKDDKKYVLPPSFHNSNQSMSPITWMPKELWNPLMAKIIHAYDEKVARESSAQ